jgi:hypothetical protein
MVTLSQRRSQLSASEAHSLAGAAKEAKGSERFRQTGRYAALSHEARTTRELDPAPAAPAAADQSQDQQKHNGSNEGIDDQSHDTRPKVNPKLRQQPITDEGTDQTDEQIADQSKTATLHHPACQITGNDSDENDDEQTLIGQMHDVAL